MKTETKVQHTAIPWTKSEVQFDRDEWLKLHAKKQTCIGRGMDITAIVYGPDDQEEANAAFIVRSVNAHEEMLQALKAALITLGDDEIYARVKETYGTVQKAIARAEARP